MESSDYPVFVEMFNGKQVECLPLIRQEYQDCYIEAGETDHAIDTIFLHLVRGDEGTTIFLRPDEAAAICYALGGTLFSVLLPTQRNK